MDDLGRICQELCERCNAIAVLLLDSDASVVARAGLAPALDAAMLARLQDPVLLARLTEERESTLPLDASPARHLHLRRLPGRMLLAVFFDDNTSLGLVRLRARGLSEQLQRALAE